MTAIFWRDVKQYVDKPSYMYEPAILQNARRNVLNVLVTLQRLGIYCSFKMRAHISSWLPHDSILSLDYLCKSDSWNQQKVSLYNQIQQDQLLVLANTSPYFRLQENIQRWMPTNKHVPAIILRDLFEMVKRPFQGVVGDLQLEDETITAWITWYTWHSMTHAIMQQKLSYQDTVLSWHVSDVSFDSTVLFRIMKKPWFLLLQAEKLLEN